MNYVYLVCSKSQRVRRTGGSVELFTKSEIDKEINALSSSVDSHDTSLNVLQCCSSCKKALTLRKSYNSSDELRFCQFTHKNSSGSIISIELVVYYYYIVKRVLF